MSQQMEIIENFTILHSKMIEKFDFGKIFEASKSMFLLLQ